MRISRIVVPLVLAAFLALFFWPTLRWLVQSWLSNPYYSHGFLVPFISVFFIWVKRDSFKKMEPSIVGAFVLTLGAILYIMGFVWAMRFLSALSLIVVLVGMSLTFFGGRATRSIGFPLLFLLFMIPPPFIQELGFSLQTVSIDATSWLLRSAGIPITTVGNAIHIKDMIFSIGLICSGINTLIALLALTAVYAYLLTGPSYKKTIIFAFAFPIAILANIIRITAVILIANYHGDEAAMTFHDFSSPLFFIIAFLFLILLAWILRCKLSFASLRK